MSKNFQTHFQTLTTCQTKIGNVCMSENLELFLLLPVLVLPVQQRPRIFTKKYHNLFKIVLNRPDFKFSKRFFGPFFNTTLCLKKYDENQRNLCLIKYIVSKLLQKMSPIKKQIFMTSSCATPLNFVRFSRIFILN